MTPPADSPGIKQQLAQQSRYLVNRFHFYADKKVWRNQLDLFYVLTYITNKMLALYSNWIRNDGAHFKIKFLE